ncbi:head GIN domain-containing protein [Arenibacter latericius]|uniref:head GIN domain-containing protein n=1 Tax=Arenibacter latericius TaxID=86104 RepID=UPI0003FDB9E5|nr:head GIN domain-containing protein [Arenibacter latericius]MDX1364819.1 head GIN domain-containing protein [Arenibacter latericius]
MTTLARITITLILTLLFSSCGFDINIGQGEKGNGNIQKDKRAIEGEFSAISASEGLDVYVSQGTNYDILVEGDENIIDLIATDLKNGILRIHTVENIGRATKNVYVTLPNITVLKTSSGAELIAISTIKTEALELNASSGSSLNIDDLNADKISANTSSGANIAIAGQSNTFNSNASSGSEIKASNLTTAVCRANASSGANISINVTESIYAEASSGADIKYTGNPKVESKKYSSGSVSQL